MTKNSSSLDSLTARLFELYAEFIWPVHRRLSRKTLACRCSRCINSEHYSPLEQGVCAECRNHDAELVDSAPDQEPAERLAQILNAAAGRGEGSFDALALLSGGKDSAFLCYLLSSRFPKLRLLTLTVDSGFLSAHAVGNAQCVAQALKLAHIIYRPKPQLFSDVFRYAFTHLGQRSCYEVVDRLDGDLVHDLARNIAADLRIPLVLSGISAEQAERVLGVHSFEMAREVEDIPRRDSGGFSISEICAEADLLFWWNPARHAARIIPHMLLPLVAWRSTEEEIRREVVRQKLLPSGRESPLVTNNVLIPLMGVLDVLRLGYSSFEPEFARLVRLRQASRSYWLNVFQLLEYCARTGFLLRGQVRKTLARLDLTPGEAGLGRDW